MGRVFADVFRFWRQGGACAGELLAAAGLYRCAGIAFVPVLAGAMLNLGFYGIMRVNLDLVPVHAAGSRA